jgi:nicotinamide mononucleotide transporter
MGIPSLNRLDVASSTIAVGAMYLMSARHTEHWLLWVVANSLFAYLFYSTGYHLIAGQYLLFILMAIWGWHSWVHKEKT